MEWLLIVVAVNVRVFVIDTERLSTKAECEMVGAAIEATAAAESWGPIRVNRQCVEVAPLHQNTSQ